MAHQSSVRRAKSRKIVLAIGAHPDDVEIGCGGILAKHHAEGDVITILTLSEGEIGGDSALRRQESDQAAACVHAQLYMGNFTDTEIHHSMKTIQYIEDVINQVQPTHVYTHSVHDNHQDHRNTYYASVTAARAIPSFYSYLSPSCTVDFKPNMFINIDDYLNKKLEMVGAFDSQSAIRPYLKSDLIHATARYWGRFCNYHLAEPLEVIRDNY